ncbi:flavoprotein [Kitasatospora aburaviensis]|uniref:Flavoprotein n=1 Tax=Kitasatospora aburaviensis TaxID=67265 RepID=A0ABW1F607_9ACTN
MTRTLYVIGSAAPPVRRIAHGIRLAQAAGWDTCLVLTPYAHRWAVEDPDPSLGFGIEQLQELTGHPVRWQYKLPSQQDVLPPADAFLSVPLTFNTLNKWADGHSDTLAVGLLTEALGLAHRPPIVALPHWNDAQAAHPVVARNVAALRGANVNVLLGGEAGFHPHPPGRSRPDTYPWEAAIAALPSPVPAPAAGS